MIFPGFPTGFPRVGTLLGSNVTELVMRGTYDNCGSISSDEGRFLPWSACVVSHGAVGDRSG